MRKDLKAPDRSAFHRPWIWLVYLVLFGLSVPWYLPANQAPPLWLGLPYWVVISLLAVLGIACFTAWLIQRSWPLDEDEALDDR